MHKSNCFITGSPYKVAKLVKVIFCLEAVWSGFHFWQDENKLFCLHCGTQGLWDDALRSHIMYLMVSFTINLGMTSFKYYFEFPKHKFGFLVSC